MKSRIVVAAGIVHYRTSILVTRRLGSAEYGGFWEFPGGKVEIDEDPRETVERELREECGLEVTALEPIDIACDRRSRLRPILLFFDCSCADPTVVNIGIAESRWIKPRELDQLRFPPANQRVIGKIMARSQSVADWP